MQLRKNLFYFVIITAILFYICYNLASQLIFSVNGHNLYPLWDPATHALYGWKMYYNLVHFQPLLFLWEVWSKGLWPFMYYLYQIPFYFLPETGFDSALFSSLFSYFFIGILSFILFSATSKSSHPIASSVFLFFLITSPLYLGFSSLAMTETFGGMMQLLVFIAYLKVLELKTHKSAVVFSILLSMLFFTKYNYFILVLISILLNEYLNYTKSWNLRKHFSFIIKLVKKVFTSFTGLLFFFYSIFLFVLFSTGGFEFHIFNQKVSVHSIGNTGYVLLYLLIIRFWIYKKKNKSGYLNFLDQDYRLKPVIKYFIIPLTIWFAIPYPNHIKEFFGLVVNRQSEGFTFVSSAAYYFNVLKDQYFANGFIFVLSLLIFLSAVIRYKAQNQITRFFILAALIQIVLVVNHPYKDARFIFTALIPVWIVIAFEINYLITKLLRSKVSLYSLSLIFILSGLIFFHNLSTQKSFNKYTINFYTESKDLTIGIDEIKKQLGKNDRLAITGSISNNLSPALLEWEFGSPAGFGNYVGVISSNDSDKLKSATHLLVLVPFDNNTNIEMIDSYRQQAELVSKLISKNKLQFLVDNKTPDLKIYFKLYKII